MNIHIKDEQLFKRLKQATYLTVTVGSKLYGCSTVESDSDFLHFYSESEDDAKSYLWTHHQVQYKDGNSDHNFTTIRNFIRNLLTGDSTINYEVLFSEELKLCKELDFLQNFVSQFSSYNLLRSYLGFAKRDLKMIKRKFGRNKEFHVKRAIWTFDQVLNQKYSNQFQEKDSQFFHELMSLKLGKTYMDIKLVENEIETRRIQLNQLLNDKKIEKSLLSEDMILLDGQIILFQKTDLVLTKQMSERIVLSEAYDALFNDVEY
jgi:hypothetical protein